MTSPRTNKEILTESSEKPSIFNIATAVRNEFEEYYEDTDWTIGECRAASLDLAGKLNAAGYDAKAVMGTYNCVDESYLDRVDMSNSDDDFSDWDNKWKHWWVECNGKIIDITADQFHPTESKTEYKIIITDKSDPCYGNNKNLAESLMKE